MTNNTFDLGEDTQPEPTKPQHTQQQQNTNQQFKSAADVFGGLAGLGRRTATSTQSNESIAKIKEHMDAAGAAITGNPDKPALESIIVDDPTQLRIPAIVLVSQVAGRAYYFTILLEALGDTLEPVTMKDGRGGDIAVDRPTARYYDRKMQAVVRQVVENYLQQKGRRAEVVNTYFGVLPRTIDLSEPRSVFPFYDIAISCIDAYQRIESGDSTSSLRASQLITATGGIQIVASHQIEPHSIVKSVTGEILHSDFSIGLIARNKNVDPNSVHNVDSQYVITNLTGYLDYAYRGNNASFARPGRVPGVTITPQYDPLLVITETSPLGKGDRTQDDLLTQLLGLSTILGLASKNRWYTIEMRDSKVKPSVGNFGWETCPYHPEPQGAEPHCLRITNGMQPAKGKEVGVTARQVLEDFVLPTMTIAMDVTQGGILSWSQSIIATAQKGSKSERLINNELNAFSGGVWGKIWDGSQPILSMPSVEHHAGTYRDADNNLRDIRSITHLEWLSKLHDNIEMVQAATNAILPGTCNAETIAARKALIARTFPSVTFTGMHTRCFLNSRFIEALGTMLEMLGMQIQLENLFSLDDRGQRPDGLSMAMPLNGSNAFGYYSGQQGSVLGQSNYFNSNGFGYN